jgi:hypothetical protein
MDAAVVRLGRRAAVSLALPQCAAPLTGVCRLGFLGLYPRLDDQIGGSAGVPIAVCVPATLT